jgi:hypothetical protein
MTNATLQPSSSVCHILSNDPTVNYNLSASQNGYLGEPNNASDSRRRWLIKFNGLSDGTIPSNAIVTSAILSLYLDSSLSNSTRTFRVYRQKRVWVAAQATWNSYSTGNGWQTAGGFGANDCEQTDIGNISLSSAPATGFKDWILDNQAIQEIISGAWSNNGFLMKADTESNDAHRFQAQGASTAGNRPKLFIEYTLGGGGFFHLLS